MKTSTKALTSTVTATLAASAAAPAAIIYWNPTDITVNWSDSVNRNIWFDLVTGDASGIAAPGTWQFRVGFNPGDEGQEYGLYGGRSISDAFILQTETDDYWTARLAFGDTVGFPAGSGTQWKYAIGPLAEGDNVESQWQSFGKTPAEQTGYIGLMLYGVIPDELPVYGWARITYRFDMGDPNNTYVTLHDFAYDSTGANIAAGAVPEPSSFLLLALGAGAAGLMAHRRKKQLAAKEAEATLVG